MKSFIFLISFIIFHSNIFAKGVSAATMISSSVSLTFSVDNIEHTIRSNTTMDIVEQLLRVKVVSLDAQNVLLKEGASDSILSFKVSNSGNGFDNYKLSFYHNEKSMFEMKNIKIYIDSNNNFFFDEEDQIGDNISLLEDESKVIFIVSDIPNDFKIMDGSSSVIILKAVSTIGGSGIRGEVHKKKGVKGVDAIDGIDGGVGEAEGSYLFRLDNEVLLTKYASSHDARLISGSIISYEINVSIAKDSMVWNLEVSDDIPKYTMYERDSLTLNGVSLSDEYDDSDIGYFDCNKNSIVLEFGCLKYPSIQNIKFNVRIK